MRFFTADTHGNHLLMAKECGLKTVEEYNTFTFSKWNKQVRKKDEVWHLGDFCFGNHDEVKKYRSQLNGKIHLILGNHDYTNKIYNIKGLFESINDLKEIKIKNNSVILCHYAMRVWSKSHYNSWQLYGHSHGKLSGIGKQFDVGLANNNFILFNENDIVNIMNILQDNFNLIKKG